MRDATISPARRGSSALRRAWGVYFRTRFRLFGRHRYDRLVLEEVEGRPLVVLPSVFNPKLLRTGAYLAETLTEALVPRGGRVLDMGTGTGVGAVFAASWAGRVDAVDVNPEAVRCARINALLHGLEDRVSVYEGDLFEPVGGRRYDVVLFNPPYYRGEPRDAMDRAWRSIDVAERFAAGLGAHLAPGGCALVVLSSDGDADGFLRAFAGRALACEAVAETDLRSEVVTIYRVSRSGGDDAGTV